MHKTQIKKDEHLVLALNSIRHGAFNNTKLKMIEPTNINLGEINTEVTFLGHTLPFPSYINAMTGGGRLSEKINHKLMIIANHYSIPVCSGSLKPFLKYGETKSYLPLKKAKIKIANLSARHNLEDMKKCTQFLDTEFITLHLNTLQELLQEDGDIDFSDEVKNIKNAVKYYKDKLIIKMVGQGINRDSFLNLINLGVKNIDVSGSGGTSFSDIENRRKNSKNRLNEFEITTEDSLKQIKNTDKDINIIASGGIDSPLDMAKSLALGANLTASSYYYLRKTFLPQKKAIQIIDNDIQMLKKIMLLSSSSNINELKGKYYD